VSKPQHNLPRRPHVALEGARHALGAWVISSLTPNFLRHLTYSFVFSSGGDRGSGSKWYYDGGALIRKSMQYQKPVIVVSFKYVVSRFIIDVFELLTDFG
jgi:hypothetical protein